MSTLLEIIWVWTCMVSGTWNWPVSWNGAGRTCWIFTWRFNWHVSWIGTCKLLWYKVKRFGCYFTERTVWLNYWHLWRIFGWMITVTSTCNPTWISKSRSFAWFFVWIYLFHDHWNVSLEILLYTWLNIFGISIGVVLGLTLKNSSETLIGSLIWSLIYLELGTLVGTLIGTLLGNYLGRSLEKFPGYNLYLYVDHL